MFQEFYLEQPDPLNKKVLYLTKNISPPNKKFFYPPKKKIFIIQNNNFFYIKQYFYFHLKQKSQKMLPGVTLKKLLYSLKTEFLVKNVLYLPLDNTFILTENRIS